MAVTLIQVVRVPIYPQFVGKAVIASLWKSSFIKDTFVRDRSHFERFQRSFVGDMAKLAVKWWLESQGLEVVDWDDVRLSWKSQKKDFDLRVGRHGVEVRSSVAPAMATADLLSTEHIIHPCNVRVKESTVQVFFRDSRCHEALLFGWATREDLHSESLRSRRRIGKRLVDFYLMPFSHPGARPIRTLPSFLTG